MTVDSILGEEPLPIPQQVLSGLGLSAIFEQPISALLLAACAVLIVAALSGICSYLSRMGIAKVQKDLSKRCATGSFRISKAAVCLAQPASDR